MPNVNMCQSVTGVCENGVKGWRELTGLTFWLNLTPPPQSGVFVESPVISMNCPENVCGYRISIQFVLILELLQIKHF